MGAGSFDSAGRSGHAEANHPITCIMCCPNLSLSKIHLMTVVHVVDKEVADQVLNNLADIRPLMRQGRMKSWGWWRERVIGFTYIFVPKSIKNHLI